ncbi:GNAT superfamily N-acetyltransferase [Streptacidiphilus sp. MAP12-16]|uniref:GNAT family N-acetyltransferase n=1 Tax=Streptacidiphilus sp. MAP12-16 TaxID=3156300 RepID=UPI0035179963
MQPRLAGPLIRDTTPADVADIVRLRAASWRAAYAGLIPPVYLDAMETGPEVVARAVRRLEESPDGYYDLVAEREGRIVAFVMCGPERPMPEQVRAGTPRGEVYALYAHPGAWSTGAGASLLAAARDRLRADGHERQVLWVLEGNTRGRAFYERQGLHATGERTELQLGGVMLTELQYGNLPAPVVNQRRAQPDTVATPARRGS